MFTNLFSPALSYRSLRQVCSTVFSIPLLISTSYATDTIAKVIASGPDTGINQQFGPRDINSRGEIVGTLLQRDGLIRAYRAQNGKHSILPTPRGFSAEASAINSEGFISGTLTRESDGVARPTAWSERSAIVEITIPSDSQGRATKLNDRRLFVGEQSALSANCFSDAQACDTRGFQFGSGIYLPLPQRIESVNDLTHAGLIVGSVSNGGRERAMSLTPGRNPFELPGLGSATYSVATAVNSGGTIVGKAALANSQLQAFLWNNGRVEQLGALSEGYSVAHDINALSLVVGDSELVPGGLRHPFIWSRARGMEDLNQYLPEDSPWELMTATAINDRGEIVGRGTKYGEQSDYVLRLAVAKLTPDRESAAKIKNKRGVAKRTTLRFDIEIKDSQNQPLAGSSYRVERSTNRGKNWSTVTQLETDEDGREELTINPTRSAQYRLVGPLGDSFLPAYDTAAISVKVR